MENRTLAIIALVLAILVPLVGLIIGIVVLARSPTEGRGLAIAAVVIGAILTLLPLFFILLGSIAYFGVVDPSTMMPDRCSFQAGIACNDFSYENGRFDVEITNGLGRAIVVQNVRMSGDDIGSCSMSPNARVANADTYSFSIQCDPAPAPVRAQVEFDYLMDTRINVTRTIQGEIFVN